MQEETKLESGRDLGVLREEIDAIDTEIVCLFEKRMGVSEEVARYKIRTGKQVLDQQREERKIASVMEKAHGDFNRTGTREIFSQIMAISRKRQYQVLTEEKVGWESGYVQEEVLPAPVGEVVFQGTWGAYGHAATRAFFGEKIPCRPVPLFKDAMEEVARGRADYAILPIENSTAGFVSDIYDLLTQYPLSIVGEQVIQVDHVLLGLPGASLSQIRRVISHPQALSQCRAFLEQHPSWQQEKAVNTALSAKHVAEMGDAGIAAIASLEAGQLYGLIPLARGLCPDAKNATRFVAVGREGLYVKGASKVSICFELNHTSGSLYQLLSHIIYNGLNMTRIESRPIPDKAWEYRFFVDFEGNLADAGVVDALRGIEEEANFYRILGNY